MRRFSLSTYPQTAAATAVVLSILAGPPVPRRSRPACRRRASASRTSGASRPGETGPGGARIRQGAVRQSRRRPQARPPEELPVLGRGRHGPRPGRASDRRRPQRPSGRRILGQVLHAGEGHRLVSLRPGDEHHHLRRRPHRRPPAGQAPWRRSDGGDAALRGHHAGYQGDCPPRPAESTRTAATLRGYSFPSGHSAVTFAAATVLQQHLGWKAAVPTYLVASYVAMSRLHDNRHFASDVVAGAAEGIIIGRSVTWHGRNFYGTPMLGTGTAGVMFSMR